MNLKDEVEAIPQVAAARSMFSSYRILIEMIVIVAVIAFLVLKTHEFLEYERNIGYQKAVAEYTAKQLEQEKAANEKLQLMQKQLQEAQQAAADRERAIRETATAASAVSASLRDTVASIRAGLPAATVDALRKSADALGAVFAECQERRRAVAEDAERLNNEKRTLIDAWPK